MVDRVKDGFNVSTVKLEKILKIAIGVKNMAEENKRVSIRREFNMWTEKIQTFSNEFIGWSR